MKPTIIERIMSYWIKWQVKAGLIQYGRQRDGSIGGVVIPLGFSAKGSVHARIYKASTGEWRNFGIIASTKPSLLKRLIYANRVKKANEWLRS